MRGMRLFLAVAAVMAAIVAFAGPSVANTTQPKQESYADRAKAQQYFARPPSALNSVGISMFRGSATDIDTTVPCYRFLVSLRYLRVPCS